MDDQSAVATVHYGIVGCVFSIVASSIGSGIVALPYALKLTNSFTSFFLLNLLSVAILLISVKIMLMIRSNVKQSFPSIKSGQILVEDDNEYKQPQLSDPSEEEP